MNRLVVDVGVVVWIYLLNDVIVIVVKDVSHEVWAMCVFLPKTSSSSIFSLRCAPAWLPGGRLLRRITRFEPGVSPNILFSENTLK